MTQLSVCHGSSIPEERHFLGAKLKEHSDVFAGGNRDMQHSCLRASAESQSSGRAGRDSLRRRRQEITNPLLIPFLFCNPSPVLTIFENTDSKLLLQWLKKEKNLSSRENCFASPIFLWL